MAGSVNADAVAATLSEEGVNGGAFAPTLDGAPGPLPVSAPALPQIGHFVLMQKLGAGGMGTVFAAYDDRLDRRVAIKLLHMSSADQGQWQRTLREAKALARVSHPNVVAVYEVGEANGLAYLAMEYADGVNLRVWQKQSKRSWQELLSVYLLAGQGLAAAHQAEIVHRDFKPANVLVGADGRARVVDFGLARLGSAPAADQVVQAPGGACVIKADYQTAASSISGTPGYMAPEQYVGGPVDSRSDQWSFAASLFEALYGRLPFDGKSVEEFAANVTGKLRPPPGDSPVPIEIYHLLARALSTRPEDRFPSMAELLQALTHEQGDSPAGAAISRRRALIPVVSLAVVLSAIAQLRSVHGGVPISHTVLMSLALLSLSGSICFALRRTLLRNAFHRRIVFIVLATMGQNLAQRLVAMRLGLSMYSLLPLEMIVWAGGITALAGGPLPALRWLPAPLLAVAAAALLLPRTAAPYLSLAYPLVVASIGVAWTRVSARVQDKRRGAARAAGHSAPDRMPISSDTTGTPS